MRSYLALGAISAAIAVAAGAFGAHALRARLDARALEIWETAARYQMYHALALMLVAVIAQRASASGDPNVSTKENADAHATTIRTLRFAGAAFVAGSVVFSGSLYAMALTGITALGAITPLGGAGFLAGWITLAVAARRMR
jgi:uncharacterized membrane protein YgdD (TMEM256/DUF423 family)